MLVISENGLLLHNGPSKSFQWGEPQQYTSVIFVRQKWSEHWQMSWLVGQRPEQSKIGRLKSKFLIGRQSDS